LRVQRNGWLFGLDFTVRRFPEFWNFNHPQNALLEHQQSLSFNKKKNMSFFHNFKEWEGYYLFWFSFFAVTPRNIYFTLRPGGFGT